MINWLIKYAVLVVVIVVICGMGLMECGLAIRRTAGIKKAV